MPRIIRLLVAIGAAVSFSVMGMLSSVAANATTTTTNSLSYEFDNGVQWMLQKNTAAIKTIIPDRGYADAGIVVDLGQVHQTDALTGVEYAGNPNTTGNSNGSLGVNMWFSSGSSEANTPGTHSLSDPVDFSYGFVENHGEDVYMVSGPYAGDTLTTGGNGTVNQVAQDFAGDEAYAWVGAVYTGHGAVGITVTGIGSGNQAIHSTGTRSVTITPDGNGKLAVTVH